MVERRRVDGFRLRAEGRAQQADEREVGGGVEGEGCAAAGVGGGGVGEGGELGAGEVVAVEGEEGGDGGGGAGGGGGGVAGVEAGGEARCEGCFAWGCGGEKMKRVRRGREGGLPEPGMPAMAMRRRLDFGSCSYLSGGSVRFGGKRLLEGDGYPRFCRQVY